MSGNHDQKNEGSKQPSRYWQSLEEWQNDPKFREQAEKEFLSSPLAEENEGKSAWARREFLTLMGASLALSTAGCVRRVAQKIVPYAQAPVEIIPGIANYYTSIVNDAGEVFSVLVKTREGRPIKLEGNPKYLGNGRGLSARAHSFVLNLFDPDRARGPLKNLLNEKRTNRDTIATTYASADSEILEALKKGGVALLTGTSASPSTKKLVGEFNKAFAAKHYEWNPTNYDLEKQSQKDCYGQEILPRYRFDKCEQIVSIGADFMGTFGAATEQMRLFSERRRPTAPMSKLVVFESLLSLTGMNADQRFPVAADQLVDVVYGLLHEIVIKKKYSKYAGQARVEQVLAPFEKAAAYLGIPEAHFAKLAEDLWSARGKSIVIAGGESARSGDGFKLLNAVNFLNSVLENDGATIDADNGHLSFGGRDADLKDLEQALESGSVKTLVIWGVNPAYISSSFAEATKKAALVVYAGDRNDETGQLSHYILPDHHVFETWSDAETKPGLFLLGQPTIEPLYETRAFQDSLLGWMKAGGHSKVENWYEYLRAYWQQEIYSKHKVGSFEDFWYEVQQTGFVDTKGSTRESAKARNFNLSAFSEANTHAHGGMTLALYATVGLRDGTLGNVSWLQEFPDPVTKVCWDNYLTLAPATAAQMKVKEWQVVKVKSEGREVLASVQLQPGQHVNVCGLALGYGRSAGGKVAKGVGVNANPFAKANGPTRQLAGLKVELEPTADFSRLANVQGHHTMEGRQIVVEATLAQFQRNGSANIHRDKLFSAWPKWEYKKQRWGMAIDLSVCTGCSACMVACQSENNIPVVGKTYVLKGREMAWMRLDRYFVGNPDNPDTVVMPMLCQHCENAPCETVCPVAATQHSEEGTNDMIYNRCVGTRYCSNNCPYKVRRFNWFSYTDVEKPLNYAMNPEVTVRHRGVMEKCTFCIHRIKIARVEALKDGGRKNLKDGEVVTACQQSCPTNAIVFGDINDPDSRVSREFARPNAYTVLEELNNLPSVHYLSKVRNTDELKETHAEEKGHHS